MAGAIGDGNPLWRDVAPPTFVDSLNPFYAGEPYPVWGGLPHFFSAGDAFTFHTPIRIGDVVDVDCRIESIREKVRADGASRMKFVTYLKEYRRAGELCVEVRWTCVLFDGDRTSAPRPAAPDPEWATFTLPGFTRVIDPLTIVRWTAASNDYERIHFDHVYAVEECGLPGIVAHGPCSAALLLKLITDRLGDPGRLTGAEFRYRSPVYANDELTFGGVASSDPAGPGEGSAVLVSAYADGRASTTGIASWSAASAATPSSTSVSMSGSE
jgi:acyl dehydratase